MAREIRVGRSDAGAVLRLKKDLANPERLLKRCGIILLEQAQASFQSQKLGSFNWPERYPRMREPYINIAGALSDLENGPSIKARRFDRRPALVDTGTLRNSLSPTSSSASRRVGSHTVEVGSTVPYAGLHQWGGEATITVTKRMQENLKKHLKKERHGRATKTATRAERKQKAETAASRLSFIFKNPGDLVFNVNQRPFLGITDTAERRIIKEVEDALADGK